MGNECTITPVCGVTCDRCPVFNLESNPHCEVMRAAIRAFHAQEDYWKQKLEMDMKGLQSLADDIGKRLDSIEREIKDRMRDSVQGKSG